MLLYGRSLADPTVRRTRKFAQRLVDMRCGTMHTSLKAALVFLRAITLPDWILTIRDALLQRFRHFMPYLAQAAGGTLKGKRVLDIACNSGFWSIQCALLGAEVLGIDARAELIEEANLLESIVGTTGAQFKVLDFWDLNPDELGQFDIVLNLGFLYHVPQPLEALELTKKLARHHILLDTAVHPSDAFEPSS